MSDKSPIAQHAESLVLSRKMRASIESCLDGICSDTFAEGAIRELMISLREFTRQIGAIEGDSVRVAPIKHFLEVCDFIGHSNRDRGVLEANIRVRSERIADALASGNALDWASSTVVEEALHSDSIVAGMLTTAWLFISTFDPNIDRSSVLCAWERKRDIALCLISLLQDSTIRLREKRGRAHLFVLSYEGNYRLYCRVFGSRAEEDGLARTGGRFAVAPGFPVIVTDAPDIDAVLKAHGREDVVAESLPGVIETYRGSDLRLHVRLCH
jgi:hypothetical protein